MRIALFVTCLADGLFPQVGQATVRLLERLGHEVTFPQAQTCCGQMHTNTGYLREALPLVRRYVEVFAPVSTAMLADKMRSVLAIGAEVCTAGDSSCLMHIGGGLSRLRAGTRTVHLAEILASVPQTSVPHGADQAGAR